MFDAVLDGLVLIVQWPAVGYLGLGVIIGMFFGAVPGLSGLVGMAILLPFTFGLDAGAAFAFLLGMYAVTTTADTLASVLLGVPGTAASQATIIDGYPMAQQGQAARALGAAYTVSMIGGVLGAIFLAASIPLVRPLILSFAEPEFFFLAILGLTMVGALSGRSIFNGLVAACLGLLLSMVGYAQFGGEQRYTFGANYLLDGLPLVPVVLGLFALPEVIDLATRGQSISRVAATGGGMLQGIRDAAHHWWLGLRCTALGVYIGMLPGLGGSIVDWVAYGHAVQSARDKEAFGKGDIRGVIAPEAANNAMKGGALLPTIAFAIPGSASMAILLGAFQIQGLEPGPAMLTDQLDITFSLVWTLAIANVLGAAFLMVWGRHVARLTFVSGHYLVPAVVLFVFMGAWLGSSAVGDWITLLVFGLVGWIMKHAGWPRPPVVLGYILGVIMEDALQIASQNYGWEMLTRPIVVILIVLVILTLMTAWWRLRQGGAVRGGEDAVEPAWRGRDGLSLTVGLLVFALFIYALVLAVEWRASSRLFPLVIGVTALLLAVVVVARDGLLLRRQPDADQQGSRVSDNPLLRGSLFFGCLVAILLVTFVIGQFLSLLLFVALYLVLWARMGWRLTVIYTVGSAVFLYVLFNRVVPVQWYESPFLTLFA